MVEWLLHRWHQLAAFWILLRFADQSILGVLNVAERYLVTAIRGLIENVKPYPEVEV